MNYYISDLHLCHAAIIRFDQRPFDGLTEMEDEIVKRWNDRVTAKDTVYILGDFCWTTASEWIRILGRLKGRKVLIRGNHDPRKIGGQLAKMFDDIKDYKEIVDDGRVVCMSHFPMLFYRHSQNENTYMLCGHVHATTENDWLEQWRSEIRANPIGSAPNRSNIINVGAMMPYVNYTPRTLDELIEGAGLNT